MRVQLDLQEDLHIIRRAPPVLSTDVPELPKQGSPTARLSGLKRISHMFQHKSPSDRHSSQMEHAASSASVAQEPEQAASSPSAKHEHAAAPAHVSGVKRLSQEFEPKSSSSQSGCNPVKYAAPSAALKSEPPGRKAKGLNAIRRGLTCLSSKPARKHASDERQQTSCLESSQSEHSAKHAEIEVSAQRGHANHAGSCSQPEASAFAASACKPGAEPQSIDRSSTERSAINAGIHAASATLSRDPIASSPSLENRDCSTKREAGSGWNSGSERARRRAQEAGVHPMLVAIQCLADESEQGDGHAALPRLAAIRSVCQAGLAGVHCTLNCREKSAYRGVHLMAARGMPVHDAVIGIWGKSDGPRTHDTWAAGDYICAITCPRAEAAIALCESLMIYSRRLATCYQSFR